MTIDQHPGRLTLIYRGVVWLSFGLALAAVLLLLAASTAATPVSNDAGAYLTMADAILAGRLPYRDLFDHKTPGIYYTFAAALALSGRSLRAVQLVQLLAVMAMAGLTGWLAWRLWGRLAGALTLLLALYGGAAYQGGHLTTEAWTALFTAAALASLLRRSSQPPSTGDWLLAGWLVGLAALFKQTGLLALPALALWAASIRGDWRQVGRRWLALIAGCTAPLLATAAFFATQGALPDLWRDAIWVNLSQYPRASFAALLSGNLINLRSFPLLWLGLLPALIFAPPSLRRSAAGQRATLLWLMLLAGLLPLLHRFYGHYVLQALPPAAALAAAGLAALWQWLSCRPWPWRALAVAGLLALALIDLPAWPRYLAHTQRLVERQQVVAAAVQALSQPGLPILAITAAPQVYFLSDRPPATRWIYLYPVNHSPAREAELADLITQHIAPVVVVDDSEPLPWHARLRSIVEANCTLQSTPTPNLALYTCH
ncbi:MAG TPA: glycosyltransferase family 39 protein [Anaerolineae bacterium]|nr:glycosyltransferase family 39 protein [Anaerolineae bacterium]HNU03081.1 glycosyltransferase family 39 protein [Anaerolineae bacterium]